MTQTRLTAWQSEKTIARSTDPRSRRSAFRNPGVAIAPFNHRGVVERLSRLVID